MTNGKFFFFVSGRKYAIDPIIIDGIPKINIGRGFQTQASFDINAEDTPNILEIVDIVPNALVLKFVGYSSPVIKYTKANAELPKQDANK